MKPGRSVQLCTAQTSEKKKSGRLNPCIEIPLKRPSGDPSGKAQADRVHPCCGARARSSVQGFVVLDKLSDVLPRIVKAGLLDVLCVVVQVEVAAIQLVEAIEHGLEARVDARVVLEAEERLRRTAMGAGARIFIDTRQAFWFPLR